MGSREEKRISLGPSVEKQNKAFAKMMARHEKRKAMTVETPPAADGGLPGPLLQRLCDISKTDHARGCQGRQYSCDCGWDGRTMDTAEEAFAWINAQSALLAKKNAKIEALESLRPHWAQGYSSDSIAAQTMTAALVGLWEMLDAKHQTEAVEKLSNLKAQLATATERLASAEAVIAPFARMGEEAAAYHYGAGKHAWGFNKAELMWADFYRARARLTAKDEPCRFCKGVGTQPDYIGLEMRCVEVECDQCKGTGLTSKDGEKP